MNITVNYGMSNSHRRDFPDGTTVVEVVKNKTIQSALGYGENVVAKIDGVTVDDNRRLVDGDEIDLEVRANSKAKIHLVAHWFRTKPASLVRAA